MQFIEALYTLLHRHGDTLKSFALIEANGLIFRLSLQLERLRTVEEQRELLNKAYADTLAALKELDEGPFSMIYQISNLLPHATISLEEVDDMTQKFADAFGKSGVLKNLDLLEFEAADLSEISGDGIAGQVLEVYKAYAINEQLLEKIKESLDQLDANKEGEKLTVEQLQTSTSPEELKEMLGVMVQQALQPLLEQEHPRFDKPYLNMDEAAAYLNMPKQTLYGHTHRRTIPVHKPGRSNLFLKTDLDEWLAKGRKKSIGELKNDVVNPQRAKGQS